MIVAGTGHRPEKFSGYDNADGAYKLMMVCMKWLEVKKPEKIISGFCVGFDLAWASAAYHLQIPYIAAIPCYGQSSQWGDQDREDYDRLLAAADEVVYVCKKPYFNGCMQLRNKYMVEHSNLLIACWNGSSGGTRNCIDYARAKKKPIKNIWKMWEAINAPKKEQTEEVFEI